MNSTLPFHSLDPVNHSHVCDIKELKILLIVAELLWNKPLFGSLADKSFYKCQVQLPGHQHQPSNMGSLARLSWHGCSSA